jgi:succinylarginine dihydrolase
VKTLAYEVNFDGLVGPTHHYAALAQGNLASQKHGYSVSNPREAALQGLRKMKLLADLGAPQGVLPPHERPDLPLLRGLGFIGGDIDILRQAQREAPLLLAAACSSSFMWAANAATVSPAADTSDGRTHFTAANLVSHLHRSTEANTTAAMLKTIFSDDRCFAHHTPLRSVPHLGDEGAANHIRLCRSHGERGLEVFVYGRQGNPSGTAASTIHPARQAHEASSAIARLHGLDLSRTLFFQQNPAAIDRGVFHNDVIAVGNENLFLYHREAYLNGHSDIDLIKRAYASIADDELVVIEVSPEELSMEEAVSSYLFNSQIVTLPDNTMTLICPEECREREKPRLFLQSLLKRHTPIRTVQFVDLHQSMKNGGGPACLRLRVVLTPEQLEHVHRGVLLNDSLYTRLVAWVEEHYRDRLHFDDLADPKLLEESRAALDRLTQILRLGSVYPFQAARG